MQQKSNINPSCPSSNPGTRTVQDLMGTPTNFAGFFYRADIWLDKNLNPIAKNLLMEIYLLEQQPLGCIASNTHLAKTLNVSKRSVERYVADLLESGHLTLLSFNGHHRKLKVNLNRLEPRQIGEEGRQIDVGDRQNGEGSPPIWRHSVVSEKNQLEESVDIGGASLQKKGSSSNKKEEEKATPKKRKSKALKKQPPQKKENAQSKKVLELPFKSEKFKEKWQEWIEYRKELGVPYKTQKAIQRIFIQLAKFQEAFVLELIDTSIANEWRGLVFPKTGELYDKWLAKKQAQAQQTPKTATGTRAKPQKDLIGHTKASNAVFRQIKAFEQEQDQFETYSITKLKDLSGRLRALWREAKALDIYDSEIQRIAGLGTVVTGLIEEGRQKATTTP